MSLLSQGEEQSSPSSPMRKTIKEKSKLEESDEELFMVPDIEDKKTIHELLDRNESKGGGETLAKKKRGRNPVDKEYRRIKRLLRNRVSAQEARERKKVYVRDLEWKEKELQNHNCKLEEDISTIVNENSMLRKILMNTRPKLDECVETKA